MGWKVWTGGLLPAAAAVLAIALVDTAPAAGAEPAGAGRVVDLDVLFVGAHPDDEAFDLSSFGQWHADHGVRSGVVTITRGEGGGNAAGPEEGPPLGALREAEERRAVAKAGITEVINLDEADFYYTVSAPLTEQAWNHDRVLGKLVRVIRETRPELVVTMDPAPTPGNHGNHQYAARLAVEAYQAAADPAAFPEQGLRPWAVSRVFTNDVRGATGTGPGCEQVRPADPTDRGYGVWSGRPGPGGKTWAQLERIAQREYVTQGWAGFADMPTDPNQLGCDYFTQVASRVPFSADAVGPDALLRGALLAGAGDLPLGTGATVDVSKFQLVAGGSVKVRVTVTAPAHQWLFGVNVQSKWPTGWRATGSGDLGTVRAGRAETAEFVLTAPAGAAPGRVRIPVELSAREGRGYTESVLELTPVLRAEQEPLPQVAEFQNWARRTGHPKLADLVPPVLALPSGGGRDVKVLVRNFGDSVQSGTVDLTAPQGFRTSAGQPFTGLAGGGTATLTFPVTNPDTTLPTGKQGGDYRYSLTVRASGATSVSQPALELVPATTVARASAAPVVDGVASPGEYAGPELDISTLWEGDKCSSAADCSARARLSWHDDTLYALVSVTDDAQGARLSTHDCKRHWRTDSVELALDPRGRSENTSTTFKLAVFPFTDSGNPCYARDADNHQGPGATSAPGVRVASKVSQPYTGYTVEVAIPLGLLPGALDPDRVGLDLFVYDSDTQDKTGQSRIGWSTWGGVQGDPYRWGRASFAGYTPPAGRPTEPPAPVLPLIALSSVDSPQSVAQSVRTGISLGGWPKTRPGAAAEVVRATGSDGRVKATVQARGVGTVHLFVVDERGTVLGDQVVAVPRRGRQDVWIPTGAGRPVTVLAGFSGRDGSVFASQTGVR